MPTPTDAPGVTILEPAAAHGALLWRLAQTKVHVLLGHAPETLHEWNAVTAAYHALVGKPRTPIKALSRLGD